MIVYHMSETLKLNDELKTDYKRCTDLTMPFVQAEQLQNRVYRSNNL